MNNQKGQSTVEFALILPLFLMILFGAIYGGMMFYDFWQVQSETDMMARKAMFDIAENGETFSNKETIINQAKDNLKNSDGKLELTAYKVKTVSFDDPSSTKVTAKIQIERKNDIPSIVANLLSSELTFTSSMPIMQ